PNIEENTQYRMPFHPIPQINFAKQPARNRCHAVHHIGQDMPHMKALGTLEWFQQADFTLTDTRHFLKCCPFLFTRQQPQSPGRQHIVKIPIRERKAHGVRNEDAFWGVSILYEPVLCLLYHLWRKVNAVNVDAVIEQMTA